MRALILVVMCCGCREGIDTDPLSHLPKHGEQLRALCDRGRDDAVTAVFCDDAPPNITSLRELEDRIGLDFQHFSMTANSTGLSARSVSAINPRAVIVQFPEE